MHGGNLFHQRECCWVAICTVAEKYNRVLRSPLSVLHFSFAALRLPSLVLRLAFLMRDSSFAVVGCAFLVRGFSFLHAQDPEVNINCARV